MDKKYNWNLQDIFENEEQFKKEKNEIIVFYFLRAAALTYKKC